MQTGFIIDKQSELTPKVIYITGSSCVMLSRAVRCVSVRHAFGSRGVMWTAATERLRGAQLQAPDKSVAKVVVGPLQLDDGRFH